MNKDIFFTLYRKHMGKVVEAVITDQPIDHDHLRIDLEKKSVEMGARLLRFKDRDTHQVILYIPSMGISGYGAAYEKAKAMLDFSINEYFEFLVALSPKKLDEELASKGWKQNNITIKEFSNAFVSSNGEPQDFNAAADEIEHLTVQV